jgi:hypothetical protein
MVAVPRRAIAARSAHGLRLETPSEARVLAATVLGTAGRSGMSAGWQREILARLQRRGWLQRDLRPAVPVRQLVGDSLIIEAKVADWRRAVSQLARTRSLAHRSALAIPVERQRLVARAYLKKSGLGLVTIATDGHVRWLRQPVRSELSLASDLWLVELVLRGEEP